MYVAVLILHILVCIFLIIVVLLQSGKAADLAGAFGGMGSQTAFGPRGSATLLSKATTISAVIFMVTSMTLSIVATRASGLGASVLDTSPASAPAKSTPAPAPAPQSGGSGPSGTTYTLPSPGSAAPAQAPAQTPAQAPAQPQPAPKK